MTTVLNPLAYKDIGPTGYYWFLLGTRNRIHYCMFLVELQKAAIREVSGKRNGKEKRPRNRFLQNTAIREDPGSFREEKREERNRPSQKPAVREVPGRFREGFREGVGALKSCFYAVSLRFPDTIFPQSGPCIYGKQKGGTREVTNDVFLPDGPGIHFPGEKPCGRNRGFSSVSLARF